MRSTTMWRSGVAVAALVLLTAQTPAPATSGDCPKPEQQTHAFLAAATFALAVPRGKLALATVADEAARERGLMCVTRIPHGRGMIFVFPGPDTARGFWMKNTLVDLDMVFVAHDGRVTAVSAGVPATQAGTPDANIARRDGVGRYVIELGAGDAARYGLTIGTALKLPTLKVIE